MRRPGRLLLLFALLGLLSGCATSSLFLPYPARAAAYQQAMAQADFAQTLAELDKKRQSRDKLLFLLERGRLASLAGNIDGSLRDYDEAIAAFRAIDERAYISLSYTAAQGMTLLSNDNALPYQGADYERIFLHQFQALNYVSRGELSAALVEVRRANQEQELARERHQQLIDKAEREAQKRELDVATEHYARYFAPLDSAAGRVKNSFQNAYTFYTSALLYEAAGQWDDAYIDYKRALEIFPGNRYVQEDVLRLAQRLRRREDIAALEKRIQAAPALKANEGMLIVLYEQGLVPPKQAISIPIPWPQAWYMVSFPAYSGEGQAGAALEITAGQPYSTEPIVDVPALAARALKDNLLPLLLRQTLRAYSKHELAKQMQQKNGELLGVLTQAYNLISEQADLRSWLTLPQNAQIARLALAEGQQSLRLRSGPQSRTVTVPITRGRMTLLRVTEAGGHLYTSAHPL